MDFLPFPKIPSGPSSRGTSSAAGTWVAQEKIHGAQLVVGLAGETLRIGKRKAWLDDHDAFFGWQLLRPELARLAKHVGQSTLRLPATASLYLYGELFGGAYPHPDVAAVPGLSAVQTGIWYCPDIRWSVFDAVVCPDGSTAGAYFLGYADLVAAVAGAGGSTPPVLGRGRKGDLDRIPLRFATKVPAALGLPKIEPNWAEGLVLKAEGRVSIETHAIVKRKIEEFDEKRFDESEAWDPDRFLPVETLLSWVERLVNAPRIAIATSKVGKEDRSALVDEIVLDVLVDMEEAFLRAMKSLAEEDEARLRAAIVAKATRLL